MTHHFRRAHLKLNYVTRAIAITWKGFAKVFKNLAKYRSENNFVYQNNYVHWEKIYLKNIYFLI